MSGYNSGEHILFFQQVLQRICFINNLWYSALLGQLGTISAQRGKIVLMSYANYIVTYIFWSFVIIEPIPGVLKIYMWVTEKA